jgi:hypothetical protein
VSEAQAHACPPNFGGICLRVASARSLEIRAAIRFHWVDAVPKGEIFCEIYFVDREWAIGLRIIEKLPYHFDDPYLSQKGIAFILNISEEIVMQIFLKTSRSGK